MIVATFDLKIAYNYKHSKHYPFGSNQLEKLEAARSAYLWLPFRALLSFTVPYCALLGLTGFYFALLGLTGPSWA